MAEAGSGTPRRGGDEVRCPCGRLLGVLRGGVAATKCRRCKREVSLDSAAGDGDVRCPCGRLIARTTPAGLALSCPRCKRTVDMPV